MIRSIAAFLALMALLPGPASAQSPAETFQVGAQIVTARSGQFDARELGIGGRVSWHPSAMFGIESEIDFYPADFPGDTVSFSAARLEGLFGITAGPRLARVRPFARLRAGFLRYTPPTHGFPCVAIFPPPLHCLMAGAGTRAAFDVGGGVDVFTGRRTFVRIDAGDRMVRLPAPTFVNGLSRVRETEFFSHDFRVGFGGGLRW